MSLIERECHWAGPKIFQNFNHNKFCQKHCLQVTLSEISDTFRISLNA